MRMICATGISSPRKILSVDREAGKRGLDIIGFFHSHPDWPSTPSETDRDEVAGSLVYHRLGARRQNASRAVMGIDDRAAFAEEQIEVTEDGRPETDFTTQD